MTGPMSTGIPGASVALKLIHIVIRDRDAKNIILLVKYNPKEVVIH